MKSLSSYKKVLVVIFGTISILLISSCVKDSIDMNKISNTVDWPVKYGMPIAYGNLSLGDIVSAVDKNAYVKSDNTGLLYLLYRDNIFSQTADSLLPIPNQAYPQSFKTIDKGFPVGTGLDSVKFSRDTSFVFSFNKSDVEIDSIEFKSGDLDIDNFIGFTYVTRIDVTFPTLKKNGIPLTFPIRKNAAQAGSGITNSVSIAGYKLKFVKKGATSNVIPVHYDIAITNQKQAISSSQDITSTINLGSAGFSKIFGYLGQIPDLLNIQNKPITLDFFDNSENYNVEISDPTINVYVQNSFGVPIQVQVSNTRTYSDKTSSFFLITPPPIKAINYPKYNEIGKTINDTIFVDNTIHPSIFDAVKTTPHYFFYNVTALTNPLGKTANPNFFTDVSKINVDMEIKLPFNMKAGNLTATDTFDFDIGQTISDFSIVKKIAIYNTFTNSIPFDLSLQIFLLADDKITKIDSLYRTADQPIIKSGIPDPANPGKYKPGKANTLAVTFDEVRAKKLEKVKYAIMKASMVTAGGGSAFVKFYSDYRLNCAFQVQTELSVKSLNQF